MCGRSTSALLAPKSPLALVLGAVDDVCALTVAIALTPPPTICAHAMKGKLTVATPMDYNMGDALN